MDDAALGTLTRDGDRWMLTFTRKLAHSREKVWRAVTEPEHLAVWYPQEIVGERRAGAPLRSWDPTPRPSARPPAGTRPPPTIRPANRQPGRRRPGSAPPGCSWPAADRGHDHAVSLLEYGGRPARLPGRSFHDAGWSQ